MSAHVAKGQNPKQARPRQTLPSLAWPIFAFSLATTSGSLWLCMQSSACSGALGCHLAAASGGQWLCMRINPQAGALGFYQATVAMTISGVLGAGLLAGAQYLGALSDLGLPGAVAAWGVAALRACFEFGHALECPPGVPGIGVSPQQSLAAFVLQLILVGIPAAESQHYEMHAGLLLRGLSPGAPLAVGAGRSSPPLPAAPTRPYEGLLDTCRVPFCPRPLGVCQ